MSAANKAYSEVMDTLKAFGISTADIRLRGNIQAILDEAMQPEEISRRDYFAAKAMQGLLAQSCGTAMGSDPVHGAKYAYQMADAMLKERSK